MRLETLIAIERNAKRLREILGILTKYGLADWLSGVHYEWLQSRLVSVDGQRLGDASTAVRIRLALTDLGVTFVKLGQVLSTRPDLVGPELAAELARLQAGTPADAPDLVARIIEEDLGRSPATLFQHFESAPLASASIAQVHAARLPTGHDVVIKVQHAGVEEKLVRDLDLLLGLAELAEKHAATLRPYQPVATVRQFRRVMLRELDFAHERHHLEQFARHFQDDDSVHFPAVVAPLCSRRVLTMERLRGLPVGDRDTLQRSGMDLQAFARRGAVMYLNMIFRDGFYHADPHPGNLMLLEDGAVGVLDCGMAGRLDEELREEIETMLLAAAERDAGQLAEQVLRIGGVPADCRREELRADIADLLGDYVGVSLAQFDLSGALNGLIGIIQRHHVTLPPGMGLLLKVLVMLEGTSRSLHPSFSLAELIQPFYVQTMRRRLAPHRLWRRLQRYARDWERLASTLPRDIGNILAHLRDGSFHLKLEHQHIETSVNRLVLGIVAAALFVGASMLWSNAAPPVIGGVSVFGSLGYLFAVYLTCRLLRAIRRSGNILDK
jgi:ubiquinone biosynthesis protein